MKIVPKEFWGLLSDEEFHRLCEGEPLTDKRLIKQLWAMCGRTSKPPTCVDFVFERKKFEDFMAHLKRPH
jgi:hypothetical protein